MPFRFSMFLALIFAFTIFAGAQDPQPVPVPNAPPPAGSDPNDSGYTSNYLLNYDWTTASFDADNAFLRLEVNRQRRGGNSDFIGDMMLQAQQERAANPQLLSGVA